MKTIRLHHPHTHEGIAYTPPPEGIALTVNDADAAFLDAHGLTTPARSDTIPEPPSTPRHDRRKRTALVMPPAATPESPATTTPAVVTEATPHPTGSHA